MSYSIVDFSKSLRVDNCRIRNTPNLIFLCGGETAKTGRYRSARDFFYRHLLKESPSIASRVRLAEDVNAWFRKDVFPDLLELENYMADLADTTVLFVESPGSIAELGAFAASDVLRPKTLAVLNGFYDSARSFIAEGPVLKIKNVNSQLVHYYTWDPRRLSSASTKEEFRAMTEDLTAFLANRDKAQPIQRVFDGQKRGHALLLLADLIRISGVATTTDLAVCLAELGCEHSHVQLDRYFSLLHSMALITEVLRSNQSFYVGTHSVPFIQYAYKPGAALKDSTRIMSSVRGSLDPVPRKILRDHLSKPLPKGVLNV